MRDSGPAASSRSSLTGEREELAKRLAARRRCTPRRMLLLRRRPGEDAPISPAQWRPWFLEQLRPGTNAWNTPVALRLRGELEVEALRSSLEFLTQRHRTLRTVFPAPGGRPTPVVLEESPFELPLVGGRQEEVAAFVDAEVGLPFDLEHDLMLRGRLLRLSATEHVLVLVAHHIACDGWSKGILLTELGHVYDVLGPRRQGAYAA